MQLQALELLIESDPTQAQKRLQQIRGLTRTGLEEARRALHNLRASPVEELGLWLAIKRAAELAAQRGNLQLKIDMPNQPQDLPIGIQQQLYRITEEGLNNVVRHAQAGQLITIQLQHTANHVHLKIEDDGIGFEPEQGLDLHRLSQKD